MVRARETEKTYHTAVHMVFSTKDRRRVMENEDVRSVFIAAVNATAEAENYKVLNVEFGIRNQTGYLEYPHGVVHLLVETKGSTSPNEFLEKLKKAGWLAIKEKIPDISAFNNFTRDYYIADELHYDPVEAYEFIQRRSWRTKRKNKQEEE